MTTLSHILLLVHRLLWGMDLCLMFWWLLLVGNFIHFHTFSLSFHVVVVHLHVFRRFLILINPFVNKNIRILVIPCRKRFYLWIILRFYRRSHSCSLVTDGFGPKWTASLRLSNRRLHFCGFMLETDLFVR